MPDATQELISLLSQWGLLGLERTVLDIGCGNGGLAAALAPLSAAVTGIDISPGLIAQARTRCAGFPNVRLLLGNGYGLAGVADDSIDLTVLVDTFPCLLLAEGELAGRYLAEIARVLRDDGDVVILNYSYRDDVASGRMELERLVERRGLALARTFARSSVSWDAPAFHLIKRGFFPSLCNETRVTTLPTQGTA